MKAVLVGEAWGTHEAQWQHALVWSSGRLLAKMGAKAELWPPLTLRCGCGVETPFGNCYACGRYVFPAEPDMIDFWRTLRDEHGIAVTNVFNEHPPHNDFIAAFFTDAANGERAEGVPPIRVKNVKKYLKVDALHHLTRLWDEIKSLSPNLVVALGGTAMWALTGQTGIMTLRGTVTTSERLGLKILPTLHPAAVMRMMEEQPATTANLAKAAREMEFPEIRRPERWIIVDPTFEEIEDFFRQSADWYAVDIESGLALYSKAELKALARLAPHLIRMLSEQIAMVGFARSKSHALVIPFMTRGTEDMCYWPTFDEEMRAWRYVQQGLASPIPKIFQNGIYDLSRLLVYGLRPRMCQEDTMLLHHAIYPEMKKGLGFLGSIYSDEIAWKQMYGGESLKRDD